MTTVLGKDFRTPFVDSGGFVTPPWQRILGLFDPSQTDNLNGIRFAARFPGMDIGASVNAAIADAHGQQDVVIVLPVGSYDFSTQIQIKSGVSLIGAGVNATMLNYTGSGTAIVWGDGSSAGLADNARLNGFQLTGRNNAATLIRAVGSNALLSSLGISGTYDTGIRITGNGTVRSGTMRVQDVRIIDGDGEAFSTGLQVDHSIDTWLTNLSIYTVTDTGTPLVVDTGASGVYGTNVATGRGLNGCRIQHTMNPGTGYDSPPSYMLFHLLLTDTTKGGDGLKFDSSLGTNPIYFSCSMPWCSAAGLDDSGSVVTATANGVGIYGGQGIVLRDMLARRNANNGVYIGSDNVRNVYIGGGYAVANNVCAGGDGQGVYIAAAATYVTIENLTAGNILDLGGDQKYGVKIAAVAADHFMLRNCQLSGNSSGDFSNANTATYSFLGNDTNPSSAVTENRWFGPNFANQFTSLAGGASIAYPASITSLPIYADNAAAILGGLTVGDLYRTGADPDPVCVVH